MKRIFQISLLIACFVAITGMQSQAQSAYAKVTVYTNTRQDVVGMLYQHKLAPVNTYTSWSQYFSFSANEGQTVDGGYMYQKWVLLAGYGFFIPVGTLYDLDASVSGVTVHSDSYAPDRWPEYLNTLPGIDFRSQGGE
jgi:hypothetical protein